MHQYVEGHSPDNRGSLVLNKIGLVNNNNNNLGTSIAPIKAGPTKEPTYYQALIKSESQGGEGSSGGQYPGRQRNVCGNDFAKGRYIVPGVDPLTVRSASGR